jgi:hypothetical protein
MKPDPATLDALHDFVARDLSWCLAGRTVSLERIAARVLSLYRTMSADTKPRKVKPLLLTRKTYVRVPTERMEVSYVSLDAIANSAACSTSFPWEEIEEHEKNGGACENEDGDEKKTGGHAKCRGGGLKCRRGLLNILGLLIHRHPSGRVYVRETACSALMLGELLSPSSKPLSALAAECRVTRSYLSRLGLRLSDALHVSAPWQRIAARETYHRARIGTLAGTHIATGKWERDPRRLQRRRLEERAT